MELLQEILKIALIGFVLSLVLRLDMPAPVKSLVNGLIIVGVILYAVALIGKI